MVLLTPARHTSAHDLYCEHPAYFPLIAAVLTGEQDGVVWADHEERFRQVYVEHAFGFAQVFGQSVPAFEHALRDYLLVSKAFACPKVRLYTPHCPAFLHAPQVDGLRSWRQHFRHDAALARSDDDAAPSFAPGLSLVSVEPHHLDLVDSAFGVVRRFWRTPEDFVRRSLAMIALVDGRPAALCYAAAVAGERAEIDVMTLPAFQHLGLAKAAVRRFSQRCTSHGLLPLWDCFTNNTASMALCRSTGFVPLGDPYPFFTINR